MDPQLEQIQTNRLSGSEFFCNSDDETKHTVLDFWRWSSSNLVGNTLRGWLAEYIVATAIGTANGVREEWDVFDLTTPQGVRIEVKSAAYIQSWQQKALSKPQFSIRRTVAWDEENGVRETESVRHSDVYVFCLHHHKEPDTINPLYLNQWTFFVAATSLIDQLGNQKTAMLSTIRNIGAIEVPYKEIASTIRSVYP